MKKLSIFSLIRLGLDQAANDELLRRFNNYKNLDQKNNSSCDEFISMIEKHIYDNASIELKNLEELSRYITIDDFENYEERIIAIANNKIFIDFMTYCLKESMTYHFTYILLLLCNFTNFNKKNNEFNQVIKFFTTSIFFCYVALNVFKGSDEYPSLHHNVHYLFSNKSDESLNFYLDYPNEEDNSLYFDLTHNKIKQSYHLTLTSKDIKNEERARFIHLLQKHNNELLTYKQVKSFIRDFDNFFSEGYNVMTAVQIFKDTVSDNLDTYKFIIEFIMTLFARCKNFHSLAFSLCCIDFIVYKKEFHRLYKDIESFAHLESLTPFCLIALQKLPNFQAILRRLFKLDSIYIKLPILNFININEEANFKLIVDNLDHPLLFNGFYENIVSYSDLDKKLINPNLTTKEVNRIATFISYYSSDSSTNGLINYPNILDLLSSFYKNYYHQIHNKHFFNVALLNLFDDEKSKTISSLVFNNIIYEDEITYIDEQLTMDDFNISEIKLMMEYFDYHNDEFIMILISKNPSKYLRLITCLSDELVINRCLRLLDASFCTDSSHLDITSIPDDYTKKHSTYEAANMCILSESLSLVPVLYSNLYKIGINYFEEEIRFLFYSNILALKEFISIDDDIIENLEINYQNEKSKKNKNILSKILDFKKINIC